MKQRIGDILKTQGIIIGTERFDECVTFYRDLLGLPVWFEKPGIVCLHFGDGYLMVETGGVAHDGRKPQSGNPTMLRFHVVNVDTAATMLRDAGISVDRKSFAWGEVATFVDPDGNACELKDAADPYFVGGAA